MYVLIFSVPIQSGRFRCEPATHSGRLWSDRVEDGPVGNLLEDGPEEAADCTFGDGCAHPRRDATGTHPRLPSRGRDPGPVLRRRSREHRVQRAQRSQSAGSNRLA